MFSHLKSFCKCAFYQKTRRPLLRERRVILQPGNQVTANRNPTYADPSIGDGYQYSIPSPIKKPPPVSRGRLIQSVVVGWVAVFLATQHGMIGSTMQYRRDYTAGATYFFTVVIFRRIPLLGTPEAVTILREAVRAERQRRPFHIDAMVILPDHIHAIWTLSPDDADYSIRWRNIKRAFTARIPDPQRPAVLGSRERQGEQAIWQRRFWEHRIRDETDFAHHVNYIHYNPVKHGLVNRPVDWPYSSIHRAIRQGMIPPDWGSHPVEFPDTVGHE